MFLAIRSCFLCCDFWAGLRRDSGSAEFMDSVPPNPVAPARASAADQVNCFKKSNGVLEIYQNRVPYRPTGLGETIICQRVLSDARHFFLYWGGRQYFPDEGRKELILGILVL